MSYARRKCFRECACSMDLFLLIFSFSRLDFRWTRGCKQGPASSASAHTAPSSNSESSFHSALGQSVFHSALAHSQYVYAAHGIRLCVCVFIVCVCVCVCVLCVYCPALALNPVRACSVRSRACALCSSTDQGCQYCVCVCVCVSICACVSVLCFPTNEACEFWMCQVRAWWVRGLSTDQRGLARCSTAALSVWGTGLGDSD